MTTKVLTRPQRGMQLERRTFRQWAPCVGGVSIPSQTGSGQHYVTTETSCSCGDAYWRHATCKHQIGLRIAIARYDSRQRVA